MAQARENKYKQQIKHCQYYQVKDCLPNKLESWEAWGGLGVGGRVDRYGDTYRRLPKNLNISRNSSHQNILLLSYKGM